MEGSISSLSNLREESSQMSRGFPEVSSTAVPRAVQTGINQDSLVSGAGNIQSEFVISKFGDNSTVALNDRVGNGRSGDTMQTAHESSSIEYITLCLSHCKYFIAVVSRRRSWGTLVLSADVASLHLGTILLVLLWMELLGKIDRIWTYDSSTPVSRNATIYCGTEILSLDWECKSDRLLLIGTSDGCIKAWNVDAKRVVCDLNTTKAFPSVLDIKCSPVEPIFVSAAASGGAGSNYFDNLGFASLTVWNMKAWKPVTVLPLGEDPPAITSLCFNHNGKILAASAVDGMIHMFDMSAGLQITGWPAHDSSISSILFGPDETSIFSLGSDGKIFEWSLQNQGHILWSRDCSRFSYGKGSEYCRHEMALDASGRRLLVTSSSVRAPIYQVQGHLNGWRTLPHGAPITAVDWHPTSSIFLTGSADNSVRVTSLS
ncbi:hypothetical protein PIB30_026796 [Stylosanthes scabra]|nr:hypothetical protein [Stylosanthes scabra]